MTDTGSNLQPASVILDEEEEMLQTTCSVRAHPLYYIRGHPFMTSTRKGEGVRLWWTHVDGGRGVQWTSTSYLPEN